MDTFAHAIWSYIIFHSLATNEIGLAIFFGVMPDLFSWTLYMVYRFVKREKFSRPNIRKVPSWVFFLYGLTHSIFVFGAVSVVVFLITGYMPLYLWAWLIHILIDIPTHSRKFLPTPFLWPLSEWKFPGFSWGQKWFMITNWSAIIITIIIILIQ